MIDPSRTRCGRRIVYRLIGTEDEEASSIWHRMTAAQQSADIQVRGHLLAWALRELDRTVRTARIVWVSALGDQAIDGPVAIEVGLEGLTEAGLDHGERVFFTMLERRRSMVEKMLA
jgi:hypothetical protein